MMMESESTSYPGLEFTPPPGVIGEEETEGELMVQWRKVGDRYTIVSIEGETLEGGEAPESEQPVSESTSPSSLTADEELDKISLT